MSVSVKNDEGDTTINGRLYMLRKWMLKTNCEFEYFCISNHCWNRDCSEIAITYKNNYNIYIYRISGSSYYEKQKLSFHDNNIVAIDWNVTNNKIVSLCEDYIIIIWSFDNKQNKWIFQHEVIGYFRSFKPRMIKWSPNGKKIAICCYKAFFTAFYDKNIDFWRTRKLRTKVKKIKSSILCIDWNCNNMTVIFGGTDFRCRIFDTWYKNAGDEDIISKTYKNNLYLRSQVLIFGYIRIDIHMYIPHEIIQIINRFYPIELQHEMSTMYKDHPKEEVEFDDMWMDIDPLKKDHRSRWIQSCAFSPSGCQFAFVTSEGAITFGLFIFDTSNDKKYEIKTQEIRLRSLPLTCVKFLNDTICIGGGYDGYPILFNYKYGNDNTWKQLPFIDNGEKHDNTINGITIINSHQFTTSSFDGYVILWRVSPFENMINMK